MAWSWVGERVVMLVVEKGAKLVVWMVKLVGHLVVWMVVQWAAMLVRDIR